MNVLFPILRTYSKDGRLTDGLLYGWEVRKRGERDGLSKVKSYMYYGGYVLSEGLHKGSYQYNGIIKSGSVGAYEAPTFKSRLLFTLGAGSLVCLSGEGANGFLTVKGVCSERFFIHGESVRLLSENTRFPDAAENALLFLGAPYEWGGKTVYGIDCSGLVAMSYFLSGIPIYRDAVADRSPFFERVYGSYGRGDVAYLRGHVALFLSEREAIHASWSRGRVVLESVKSFTESPELICICRPKKEYSPKGIAFLQI